MDLNDFAGHAETALELPSDTGCRPYFGLHCTTWQDRVIRRTAVTLDRCPTLMII
jgi:hypothetical protein